MEAGLAVQDVAPAGAPGSARWGRRVAFTAGGWGAAVGVISAAGGFAALLRWGVPLLCVAGVVLPTLAYVRSRGLRGWFDGLGQRRVVLFHTWRVFAAVTFWVYGAKGLLPMRFVDRAAWGDFLVALLALGVVRLWPRRGGYLLFHTLGLADLGVAVGTGVLLLVHANPLMPNIATFPVALIPLFGVGLTAASHLASFLQLRRPGGRLALMSIERRTFQGRRVTLRSARPFTEVVTRLEAAFPLVDREALDAVVAEGDAASLRAHLERTAPDGGLGVFHALELGRAMSLLGTPLQSRVYLVGNALVAQRMLALEQAAGLGAPLRVVVSQAADGRTRIDYDEPTSVFSQFPALAASPVPAMLDERLLGALTAIAA